MKSKIIQYTLFFILLSTTLTNAQNDSTITLSKVKEKVIGKKLKIDLQIRPRTEVRNGFRQLRTDTSQAAFFTSQRTRLSIAYQAKKLNAEFSVQDIRIWGAADPASNAASLQVFEAYIEPKLDSSWSLKIGKQRVMLDNERLFAQNDWRQNSGTHDGVNLIFKGKKLESNLIFAFNQSSENVWFTNYSTPGFYRYKSLGISYLKWNASKYFHFTTINFFEGKQAYTNNTRSNVQNFRYNNGGRIEFFKNKFYATVSAYYQHGKNKKGQLISAFYIQPELKYNFKKTELKLGAEIKSGNQLANPDQVDNAFIYPYGVAHRFNGTMEYFANSYPGSANDAGLIDPYFFITQKIKTKFSLAFQTHLFFTQHKLVNAQGLAVNNSYLAFENDILLIYQPNDYTKIDLGFSWLKGTETLEIIAGGNKDYIPFWSYLQISFQPNLINWSK